MKFFNTLASFIIIACLLLLPGLSLGGPIASKTKQSSRATDDLFRLFSVSVAKEPIYLILVEKNLQRLRVLEFDDELRV
ncbi:MAG: hypothetical protein ACR2PH_06750, partial [Desulfobulbia bacterium]